MGPMMSKKNYLWTNSRIFTVDSKFAFSLSTKRLIG